MSCDPDLLKQIEKTEAVCPCSSQIYDLFSKFHKIILLNNYDNIDEKN